MAKFYRGRNPQAPVDHETIRLHLLKDAERKKTAKPKQLMKYDGQQWRFVEA
jgi:hypothetical protein